MIAHNPDDRAFLLGLARQAIVDWANGRTPGALAKGPLHDQFGGAFVTIHKRGDLRGCIGHIEGDEPLPDVIVRCAVAACSSDPRFSAVTSDELPELDIELSLVGPLEPIDGPGDIEVGRHGLIVEQGRLRGLLLPQVATEWSWDAEAFLAHTCHKAGLQRDAWKHGASLWRFEAEVFGEERPRPARG